jgi:hypothetical protein
MLNANDVAPSQEILARLDPQGLRQVHDLISAYVAEPAPSLSRKGSQTRGNWGPSTQIAKENRGDLDSYLDGAVRRITAASLYRHLIALVIASRTADGEPVKARYPTRRYRPRVRPRTQAELDGLAKANEGRRLAAQARREAKASPIA